MVNVPTSQIRDRGAGGVVQQSVLSCESPQNTTERPSGENTGLIAGPVPGSSLDSSSDMDRR